MAGVHTTLEDEKLRAYDMRIQQVADAETDRYAHMGVDHELTPEEVEEERKLLRKIDWHIMPLLMITYGVQVSIFADAESEGAVLGQDHLVISSGF